MRSAANENKGVTVVRLGEVSLSETRHSYQKLRVSVNND